MARKQNKGHGRQGSSATRTGGNLLKPWIVWGGAAIATVSILIVIVASRSRVGGDGSVSPSTEGHIASPDFQLTLYQGAGVLGGEELKFSEVFARGKPIVLNFWAGLCPPCRAEMPFFQKVYDELGDQFILVGLDIGPFVGLGSSEEGRNLLQELNITYPAGTTFDASTVAAYEIRGMPTTVFLTSDGAIFEVHTGILDEATLREKVEKLIQASEAS